MRMIVLSTVGGGSAKLPRCYNRLPGSAFGSLRFRTRSPVIQAAGL